MTERNKSIEKIGFEKKSSYLPVVKVLSISIIEICVLKLVKIITIIGAAIAKIQMKKLPRLLNQRKKNAQALTELLENHDIILPEQRKNETVNWYLYTIAMKNRDKIMKRLNSSGIGARVYYSPPIHVTPYYKTRLRLTNTEWAASHVISLPIHPQVKKQDLVRMKKVLLGRD